jgi:hypothetical protein
MAAIHNILHTYVGINRSGVPKHEKTTDVNTCETSKDCIWTSSDVTGSLDIGVFSCVGTPDLCILIAALGWGQMTIQFMHMLSIKYQLCTCSKLLCNYV